MVASIQDLAGNIAMDQIQFTMSKVAPADIGTNPADVPAVDAPDEHRP
jgi:hypothetical protein